MEGFLYTSAVDSYDENANVIHVKKVFSKNAYLKQHKRNGGVTQW